MIEFFKWLLLFLLILISFVWCIAHAAPTIERTIDGKGLLLNATPCDGVGGTGYKIYLIEGETIKSGCWYNDGKHVNETIDGVETKYDKKLFELGVE